MSGESHEKETKSGDGFRLGDFSYSLQASELKDENGDAVHLRSQSTDVLTYLVQHNGELVTKADLMENVWPDTFVTDDSLVQCIADIRRALNDSDHKIIQTLPKRGYRLEAEPRATVPPVNRGSRRSNVRRRWRLALIACLAIGLAVFAWRSSVPELEPVDRASFEFPLPDRPSIAVLAFDDHSAGADRDYLSDAIAEGIITELSRFPELFVIARNSSFSFRDTHTDIRDIAQALGVRYVMEGSQQKSDNRLRVTVQLIDALEGHHLWSESFDRDLSDLFEVQDEIVRRVAATVSQKLFVFEGEEAKSSGIAKLTALHHQLKARRFIRQYTREGTEQARLSNLDSIAADPTQPYGYIGLSYVYINGYRWGGGVLDRDESLVEARKMARTALDLAPDYYDSHATMGYVHLQAGELDLAITRFEHALSLNPNSAYVMGLLVEALGYYGRGEEAEELQIRAMRLDPLHPEWMKWNLAWLQWMNGKCDDAVMTMHTMSKMPPLAYRILAIAHICLGQQAKAEAAVAQLLAHDPNYSITKVQLNFRGKYRNSHDLERYLDALRVAGLPE